VVEDLHWADPALLDQAGAADLLVVVTARPELLDWRPAQGYDEAAARWADYGHRLERARALLGAGRCLLTLGRPEGRLRLQDAHTALMALNAQPLLAEADAALGNTTALRYNRRG
jgi:hypothetical protein